MNDLSRLIKSSIRQEAALSSIQTLLNQMLECMHQKEAGDSHEEDELLHPNEVISMLKISTRTFFRYRRHQLLRAAGPGGKFCKKVDVLRLSRNLPRRERKQSPSNKLS